MDRIHVTRREFTKTLAAGAALTPLAGCAPPEPDIHLAATESTQPDNDDSAEREAPKLPDETEPALAPELPPEDLLLNVIRQRYPHERLTGEALDEVRSGLQHKLQRSEVLSRYPLKNSDEPAFTFAAWRSDPRERETQQ